MTKNFALKYFSKFEIQSPVRTQMTAEIVRQLANLKLDTKKLKTLNSAPQYLTLSTPNTSHSYWQYG